MAHTSKYLNFTEPMVVVKIRPKGPKFLQWFHLEGVYMDGI